MLNNVIDKDDPESIRQFSVYLVSGGKTLQGGQLNDFVPDEKRLSEILSFQILK